MKLTIVFVEKIGAKKVEWKDLDKVLIRETKKRGLEIQHAGLEF